MQIFGETHKGLLEQFLELPYGIPSHDTFDDVFSAIASEQLAACFEQWLSMLCIELNDAKLVAVDGKTIRRSKSRTKNATHVVTAFSSDLKLVLGQIATDEKSNEITAIPQLLKMFGLKGKTITIDAMGTQTEIAQTIVERQHEIQTSALWLGYFFRFTPFSHLFFISDCPAFIPPEKLREPANETSISCICSVGQKLLIILPLRDFAAVYCLKQLKSCIGSSPWSWLVKKNYLWKPSSLTALSSKRMPAGTALCEKKPQKKTKPRCKKK